ncbi:PP2C family protein-serine/threonine phosphatase [Sporosarcina sp. YIM B06819]|uniref:PP2C family protein-serine/threonine phosphatase n=1 Tax=Sporosarcina sp. YIM B06819 TaxID=3081769 RepID=UPI00298D22DE|nr:PP2C family protein-serine/threonine phosphatase [Sporosarcina sp. YIM B06819]
MPQDVVAQYKKILEQYTDRPNEEALYLGQQFSRRFIEQEISPEEVISIHKIAFIEAFPDIPDELVNSFDFLIEMMIHYGLALREHQSLIRRQEAIQMEINVAVKVQDTLLKTKVPDVKELDIGFITEPAKKMNGDYIYFLHDNCYETSVAIADVMGKGIPAALCMTMIKFGMDSLRNENTSPKNVLDIVNRIVEKSVDNSMFISMFFGKYDARDSSFCYGSAGHEPALMYKASTGQFTELGAKGLLLGINAEVAYEEKSVVLEEGDLIVMMTDGVTEVRTDAGFIDSQVIKSILVEEKDKSAQVIADTIYNKVAGLQDFRLRDDFTIVIFKKFNKLV